MKNLIALNMQSVQSGKNITGLKASQGKSGSNLFKDLLFSSAGLSKDLSGTMYGDGIKGNKQFKNLFLGSSDLSEANNSLSSFLNGKGIKGKKALGINRTSQDDKLESLNDSMEAIGISSDRFLLPQSSIPRIKSFLANQGFGEERINQIISNATEEDGSIRLDKLLSKVLKGRNGNASMNSNLLIASSDVTKVEDVLYRSGLGAAEVKNAIEQSITANGELDLTQISKSLKTHIPSQLSNEDIISLLNKEGISLKADITDLNSMAQGFKNELMKFSGELSQDNQKLIRQNMAALLGEKGFPPQEVKSFLESMNMSYSNSGIKAAPSTDSELDKLLNQVFVKKPRSLTGEGMSEKVRAGFKGNAFINQKGLDKNWIGNQDNRQSISNVVKDGISTTQKDEMELLKQMPDGKTEAFNIKKEPEPYSNKASHIKEAFTSDINIIKNDISQTRINAATQTQNTYNLPDPLPKVMDRMMWMIQAGEQKGRITITPPELGRLDVELTVKQGHLQANLSAENPVVKELIESSLSQLKQQLSDQGFTIDKFEVMVGLNDKGTKDQEMWGSNRGKGSSQSGPENRGDSIAVEDTTTGSITNNNRIDVHV